MPRRSSASVAMTPFGHGVNATMTRLPPPTDLDPAATVIWRRIIAGSDPQHFVAADTELLRSYCESSVLAQEAYREMQVSGRIVDGKVSAWAILHEKATRAMALLAPVEQRPKVAAIEPPERERIDPPGRNQQRELAQHRMSVECVDEDLKSPQPPQGRSAAPERGENRLQARP